jgi:hypothetical protein
MLKVFLTCIFALMVSITSYAFEGLNRGDSVGVFNRINCSSGLNCTRGIKGMMNVTLTSPMSGVLQNQVTASATTITAAQCGSTFVNAGAVQMELPEASAVIGCRLTFITGNASNFDINPDDADQILVQTNAVGDAIRNATLGNSITLQAISASQWAPVAVVGTWADIN